MKRPASTLSSLIVVGVLSVLCAIGGCVLDANGTGLGTGGTTSSGTGGTTSSGTGGTGGSITGTGGTGGVTVGGTGGMGGDTGGAGGAGGEGGNPTFTPLDIPDCVLWLRSDLGVVLDGANVTSWEDQSVTQWNVFQPDPLLQPEHDTSGQFPAVRFTASNGEELGTSGSPSVDDLLANSEFDAFFVTRAQAFFSGLGSGLPRIYFMKDGFSYGDLNWAVPYLNVSELQLLHFRREPLDVAVVRNGTEIGRAAVALTGGFLPIFRIGRGPFYMDGDMYEVILYNRGLLAEETSNIEDYLNTRYGIW